MEKREAFIQSMNYQLVDLVLTGKLHLGPWELTDIPVVLVDDVKFQDELNTFIADYLRENMKEPKHDNMVSWKKGYRRPE